MTLSVKDRTDFALFQLLDEAATLVAQWYADLDPKTKVQIDVFPDCYRNFKNSVASEFARSLDRDLNDILELRNRLQTFQHPRFGVLLQSYLGSLRNLSRDDEDASFFFLDLTSHLLDDLKRYVYELDLAEDPPGSDENVANTEEAVDMAASFGFSTV